VVPEEDPSYSLVPPRF